jgi:hypothetical protein
MKKKNILLSFLFSVVFAILGGAVLAPVIGTNVLAASASVFVIRAILLSFSTQVQGALFAGVNKEIWTDKLMEKFYDAFEWLAGVDDWSTWVEYNTINYASVGADPVILKNNAVWPIVAAQRTDTANTIVLDTYDSTTTRVRNLEEIEAAYDKLESVVKQHRSALQQEIVTECLWNYAPATAAAGAVAVTGALRTAVIGSQTTVANRMQISDIAAAQRELDNRKFPQEGRILVLNPYHREDLITQDISLQKAFADLKTGQALDLYGFKIYSVSNTPLFTKSTLAKKAYGAAADNTNDCIASVIFIQSQVMKAEGTVEMFYKEKGINPEQRSDEVGFQMRFKAVKQRSDNFISIALVSSRA